MDKKQLSAWDRVLTARESERPKSLDYINKIFTNFIELHGDRAFGDDKSIIGGIAELNGIPVTVIGEQKGKTAKENIERNFGMPNPEGYRKALRAAKMAEKFQIPLLMFIDTPGAYPGIGAEERGQSEAIAKNLQEFSQLKTPTIAIVIGEGGSGGALAIGVADRLAMMEYSVFSVISPEGCAAILWNDPSKIENATQALKITPEDLKSAGLIDSVIKEPLIGAHRDKEGAANAIKEYFLNTLKEIKNDTDYIQTRYQKLMSYGSFQ